MGLGESDAVDGGVELTVPAARQAVPVLLTGPGGLGAVPVWRAKASFDRNRRTSATSPTILAAVDAPTPHTANSVGAFISAGKWRLLEPQKQLYRFTEADDRSGDSAAPIIDRLQPDRSLETAAYLARN